MRAATPDRRLTVAEMAAGAAALVAVVPYYVLAVFTHPGTDDFCHAGNVLRHGLIAYQRNQYVEWSGRYCATFVYSTWHTIMRLRVYPLVGLTFLFGLLVATWAFVRALSPGVPRARTALRALSIYAVLVITMPVPNQTVYWLAGASAYQLGNVLTLALAARLLSLPTHDGPQRWRRWTCAALAAAAVGCNETLAPILVTVLAVGSALTYGRARAHHHAWRAACGAAVIGAAVLAFCPGNGIRSADYPQSHQLDVALGGALAGGLSYLATRVVSLTTLAAALLAIPWAQDIARAYDASARNATRALWLGLAGAWIVLFPLGFLPAWWGLGEAPPDRAFSVPHLIFISGGVAVFLPALVVIARLRQQHQPAWLRCTAVALLAVGLWQEGHLKLALIDLTEGRALRYHREQIARWELVDELRRAGTTFPHVPPIASSVAPSIATVDIGPEAGNWINECYADFFGFRSIALE